MINKLHKSIIIFLALIGALSVFRFIISLNDEFGSYKTNIPPSEIQTIEDFKKWKSEFTKTREVKIDNLTYYVIEGDFAKTLPSGKAEYYFDGNGNFLAWNIDPGDMKVLKILNRNNIKQNQINIDQIKLYEKN